MLLADSAVNSNSASEDWIRLTTEDEWLKQKARKKPFRIEYFVIKIVYLRDLNYPSLPNQL